MSFSSEVKEELLNIKPESDCCLLASICACINTIGSLELSHKGLSFSLKSDNVKLLEYIKDSINTIYSYKIEKLDTEVSVVGKTTLYEFVLPLELGNRILQDTGVVSLDESNNWSLNKGVDHHIIIEDCCKKSYIKMAFASVGNISIPQTDDEELANKTKSRGYHFELEFTNAEQAKVLSNLLGEFGFITRKVERGDKFVVYMKEAESIADFVAFVGANKSFLEMQNEMVKREMRNSINRQSNCISANIDKTVQASLTQVKAIEIIEGTIGIEGLPASLQEVARLRLENKESSLSDLVELSGNTLTKSGLNYKLKKIVEIANNL